ncbi:MAG: hypothetical protein QM750_29850 [Rubrivivax sp.]
MSEPSVVANPFMLMVQPEVVLAAIENSERLGRLNRHLCRPLDRQTISGQPPTAEADDGLDEPDTDTEGDGAH